MLNKTSESESEPETLLTILQYKHSYVKTWE